GLSLEDLRSTVTSNNLNGPKGSFDGPTRASTLDANDQLRSADAYRDLIIAYKNGSPLRIRDVASVEDDAENVRLAAWANNLPAVVLNIQRQPGCNVLDRGADGGGAVGQHLHVEIARQGGLQLRQQRLDPVDHRDHVGP
ncbi:efflux RND transporter permease subunit, partial [Pseudomonas aeruginosa]